MLKLIRSEIQDGRHCGHLENLFFASSPEPEGKFTRNFVGRIGVRCGSKIAQIVPIGNLRWQHFNNLFFASSPELKGQLTRHFVGSIGVTCRSNKSISHFDRKSEMAALAAILKIYLFASIPEQKGKLTNNFVGVACTSKIAKTVTIGNPRWPPWRPSLKSIFFFASAPEPEGQLTRNLVESIGITCKSRRVVRRQHSFPERTDRIRKLSLNILKGKRNAE